MSSVQKKTSVTAPADWVSKRLFDLCQFLPGKAHEPFIDPLGGYICVNSKFISTEGQVAKMCNQNITPGRKNDILLVMSDLPNGRALGKCFLVDEDDRYAVNQRVCILRPRSENDPQMLFHLLNRNPYFLSFNDGVNQTHLLNSVFQKCELVVPADPSEQQRVGAALSDADALVEGLERLIAKKRLIKQGAMQDLLTAKRRLPGFTGDWSPKSLSDLAHMKSGEAITSARITDDGAFPVYGGNGLRGFTSSFNKEGECTLVGRQGALCGAVVHTVGRIFASEHAIVCKAMAGNSQRYLSHLFEFLNLNRVSEASAQPGLSVEKIRKIETIAPPSEAEQERIAEILDDMDTEIQALETRLEKARQVKEGMMQNLLTGRIKLV